MRTFLVDVKPEMLVWAREYMGLTREQAAAELGKSALDLQYWEEGVPGGPTLTQLRKLADLYDVPLATFYLQVPPKLQPRKVTDYRRLSTGASRDWSLSLKREFRRIERQRAIAIEVVSEGGEFPKAVGLKLGVDDVPEAAASQIRSWLGISYAKQQEWASSGHALNMWIAAIEAHDILVAHVSEVHLREMRGFSLSEASFPVIVLNGADTPNGRIFTLLHELVHILLHSGGVCDLAEPNDASSRDRIRIEAFCNEVAAGVLLPRNRLIEEARQLGVVKPINWDDTQLSKLARRYRVSREAILRRFVTLGLATREYYFAKHYQYLREYEEERERQRRRQEGGPDYYKIKLRNLGRRYTKEVLHAYEREDITSADLASYLGIRAERAGRLADELRIDL